MLTKLYILLTNFHRPFIAALETWYFLIDQDTELLFCFMFWDELSFFSPSYLNEEYNFFKWYSKICKPYISEDLENVD